MLFAPIGRLACPGAPFNVREAVSRRVAPYSVVRGSSVLFVIALTGRDERALGNALGFGNAMLVVCVVTFAPIGRLACPGTTE